jgi:hypothetical protein
MRKYLVTWLKRSSPKTKEAKIKFSSFEDTKSCQKSEVIEKVISVIVDK